MQIVEIIAKNNNGSFYFVPKKKQKKSSYLRAVESCRLFNGERVLSPSLSEPSLPPDRALNPDLSSQSFLAVKRNKHEPVPIEQESLPDDVQPPTQLTLFYIPPR